MRCVQHGGAGAPPPSNTYIRLLSPTFTGLRTYIEPTSHQRGRRRHSGRISARLPFGTAVAARPRQAPPTARAVPDEAAQ